MLRAVDRGLRRLKADYIDIYYQEHRVRQALPLAALRVEGGERVGEAQEAWPAPPLGLEQRARRVAIRAPGFANPAHGRQNTRQLTWSGPVRSPSATTTPITREEYDAVLLDLDGVVTDTASIHARSWKRMFDDYLRERSSRTGEPFQPFEIATDYKLHVDGKPRFDGVRDFLSSRGIELPEGAPDDPPLRETVCGLGNRKNELVNEAIASSGVEVYEGTIALVRRLREQGIQIAVVTSSQNCDAVLKAAGLADLFKVRIDGNVIHERHLSGKPAPDAFLAAARELGVAPGRAVVVEDAISGVEAGRNGGFGLVIGVARKGNAEELKRHGADVVVNDLAELLPGNQSVRQE